MGFHTCGRRGGQHLIISMLMSTVHSIIHQCGLRALNETHAQDGCEMELEMAMTSNGINEALTVRCFEICHLGHLSSLVPMTVLMEFRSPIRMKRDI